MAQEALPHDDSVQALRHIYKKLGEIQYRDMLANSRRLKWHGDEQLIAEVSAELTEMGITHQKHTPGPKDYNYWRGSFIAIHIDKDVVCKEVLADLPRPPKQLSWSQQVALDNKKREILEKLLPYISVDDKNLNVIELIQVVHDRAKEDLS